MERWRMARAEFRRLVVGRVCQAFVLPGIALAGAAGTAAAAGLTEDHEFKLRSEPVFKTGPKSAWDHGEVDPGAVIFHDGKFHMLYNAMKQWPMAFSVGYATSEDGITWKRETAEPVLRVSDLGPDAEGMMATSAVVSDDGTWVLYVTLTPRSDLYMGSIVRATAASPLGPWQVDPTPVIAAGASGDWDSHSVGHASVVRSGDGYVMYYTGMGKLPDGDFLREKRMIGMARSPDGIRWKKHNDPQTGDAPYAHSDPVFTPNATSGAWDNWYLIDANVQRTDVGWAMIYRSGTSPNYGNIGFATSEDGVRWQRQGKRPIATNKDLNKQGIFFTNYVRRENRDYVWFEAGWVNNVGIYLLTNP